MPKVLRYTVCCGKISECDPARVFCTQINPSQKKAERSQLRIDRLRLTTLSDFSVGIPIALFLHDFSIPSHAAARSNPGWTVAMHALIQPLRWNSDLQIMHACIRTEFSEWLTENSCMHDPAVGCLRSMSSENARTARQRAICGNFRWQKWIPWRFLGLEKWWPAFFCTNSDRPS